MARTFDRSRRWSASAAVVAVAFLVLAAGHARAASYPAGGSGFNGGPEGWSVPGSATCNIPILCNANAGFDGANGNPAGSLALNTNILINALGVIKSEASFVSPDFVAKDGGSATLSLERQIASSNILDLTPQAGYTVTLIDRTSGVGTAVITDTVGSTETAFAGKDGAVKVVAGHTYAIEIKANTSSNVANLGVFGSTAVRFDNVSLTVGSSGGGDGGGGGGGGGGGNSSTLTSSELRQLIQSSGLVGNATMRGKRIFVKAKCPAKVGRACTVSVQGLLKKGRPATTKRTAKIAKGRAKQLVLRVKPKLKGQVAKKQRLLFKQTVRAGKARATVFKRLKLIKR